MPATSRRSSLEFILATARSCWSFSWERIPSWGRSSFLCWWRSQGWGPSTHRSSSSVPSTSRCQRHSMFRVYMQTQLPRRSVLLETWCGGTQVNNSSHLYGFTIQHNYRVQRLKITYIHWVNYFNYLYKFRHSHNNFQKLSSRKNGKNYFNTNFQP